MRQPWLYICRFSIASLLKRLKLHTSLYVLLGRAVFFASARQKNTKKCLCRYVILLYLLWSRVLGIKVKKIYWNSWFFIIDLLGVFSLQVENVFYVKVNVIVSRWFFLLLILNIADLSMLVEFFFFFFNFYKRLVTNICWIFIIYVRLTCGCQLWPNILSYHIIIYNKSLA